MDQVFSNLIALGNIPPNKTKQNKKDETKKQKAKNKNPSLIYTVYL